MHQVWADGRSDGVMRFQAAVCQETKSLSCDQPLSEQQHSYHSFLPLTSNQPPPLPVHIYPHAHKYIDTHTSSPIWLSIIGHLTTF